MVGYNDVVSKQLPFITGVWCAISQTFPTCGVVVRSVLRSESQASGVLPISGLRPREERRYITVDGSDSAGHCMW